MYRLGKEMVKSSDMESMGILTDEKLDISQQCLGSQEGQPCPEGNQAHHGQLSKGGDCPALLCSALL